MAVTQSGTSVAGDVKPPIPSSRFRGMWLWTLIAALVIAVAAIVVSVRASAYQPLGLWNLMGGFPGMHRAVGMRAVNTFGGQTGDLYIPPQHRTFAAPVSLFNSGPFAVTIEAVSMAPPHLDYPWALASAGPVLYWTGRMTTGTPDPGLPIAGLVLKPGEGRGIYVAVPVRTPRCYIPRAFQVLDYFYVKESFGPFTKWVRIPLDQPFLLNAPAGPPNQPGSGVICASR